MQAYGAALDFKLAGLAEAIDRPHVEAKLVRRGLADRGRPGSGRPPARPGGRGRDGSSGRWRGWSAGSRWRCRSASIRSRSRAADLAPAARQARIALSAPVRLEYDGTRWKLPRWRIAELLSLPVSGATQVAIAGPGAEAWFTQAAQDRGARAGRRRRSRPSRRRHPTSSRPRTGSPSTCPRPRRRCSPRSTSAHRPDGRSSPSARPRRSGRRPTRRRWGSRGVVAATYTTLRRHRRAASQPRPRRAADRRRSDRPRRDLLVQRHDRRAHGRAGLPGGAGDHQRRAPDGPSAAASARSSRPSSTRPRRPGCRSTSARNHSLYIIALPDRARRDGQLPRPGPQVHQRHRELAAAAHLRRLGAPDRQPLRRRRRTGASRRRAARSASSAHRSSASRIPTLLKGKSEVEEYGSARARDRRHPHGLRRETASVLHEDTGTRPTAPSRRWSGSARSRSPSRSRSRRDDGRSRTTAVPAELDAGAGRSAAPVYASALATVSANHTGTRVGRRVVESTVACAVEPSATSSSPRSTAYS